MGSAPAHLLGTIIMKFLLLAAALASVHAEANPAFTYATGYHLPYAIGAPLAYTTHAVAPVVYTAAAGCQNDAGAVVPCAHGGLVGVVPAAPVAPAEPAPEAEAKSWLFYRTHGYWPVGYGHLAYSYAPYAYPGGCRNYLGGLVPCAGR